MQKILYIILIFLFTTICVANNMQHAELLIDDALDLRKQGEYSKAESTLNKALGIYEKDYESNKLEIATVFNNLAMVKIYEGKLDSGEQFLKKALLIRKEKLGTNNLLVANSLNNIGSVYGRQGKYSEAESTFIKALEIRQAKLDKFDYKISESLNNLAAVYHVQKKYPEAEKIFRQVLKNIEINYGRNHLRTAAILNNIGTVCFYRNKFSEAERFHKRALKTRKKLAGKDSPEVAETFANLARVYKSQSNYFKAELYCKRALNLHNKIFGKSHPEYAKTLNNLAEINIKQGNYETGEKFHKQALAIRRKSLSKNHPDAIESFVNLGKLYTIKNENKKAAKFYYNALESLEVASKIAGSEEYSPQFRKEQRKICGRFLNAISKENDKNNYAKKAFAAMELTRARNFLDQLSSISATRFAKASETDIKKREKLRSEIRNAKKEKFSEIEISKLKSKLTEQEKEFAKKYPRYTELRTAKLVDIDDFSKNSLKPNEAMISFWEGKENVFAVVIANGKSSFIVQPLKKLRKKVCKFVDMLENEAPCEDFKKLSNSLYKDLVDPFTKDLDLEKTSALFIVPHGILTAISFESLVSSTNGTTFKDLDYFFKKVPIGYAPSAAVLSMIRSGLADKKIIKDAEYPLLSFGDPIYTKSRATQESQKDLCDYVLNLKVNDNMIMLVANDNSIGKKITRAIQISADGAIGIEPLPGSRREVEAIGDIFYGDSTNNHTFTGGKVQESKIKSLSDSGDLKKYRYIHFATHSFLPGDIEGLSEPCLALSIYSNNEKEDGFLKMGEILGMNIQADLITLSACHTGFVEPEEFNEGISGLARAFFYAGAKSMMVTLWGIDDDATVTFMENCYSELNKGESTISALNFSRKKMLEGEFAHPGLWAPFILTGEMQ